LVNRESNEIEPVQVTVHLGRSIDVGSHTTTLPTGKAVATQGELETDHLRPQERLCNEETTHQFGGKAISDTLLHTRSIVASHQMQSPTARSMEGKAWKWPNSSEHSDVYRTPTVTFTVQEEQTSFPHCSRRTGHTSDHRHTNQQTGGITHHQRNSLPVSTDTQFAREECGLSTTPSRSSPSLLEQRTAHRPEEQQYRRHVQLSQKSNLSGPGSLVEGTCDHHIKRRTPDNTDPLVRDPEYRGRPSHKRRMSEERRVDAGNPRQGVQGRTRMIGTGRLPQPRQPHVREMTLTEDTTTRPAHRQEPEEPNLRTPILHTNRHSVEQGPSEENETPQSDNKTETRDLDALIKESDDVADGSRPINGKADARHTQNSSENAFVSRNDRVALVFWKGIRWRETHMCHTHMWRNINNTLNSSLRWMTEHHKGKEDLQSTDDWRGPLVRFIHQKQDLTFNTVKTATLAPPCLIRTIFRTWMGSSSSSMAIMTRYDRATPKRTASKQVCPIAQLERYDGRWRDSKSDGNEAMERKTVASPRTTTCCRSAEIEPIDMLRSEQKTDEVRSDLLQETEDSKTDLFMTRETDDHSRLCQLRALDDLWRTDQEIHIGTASTVQTRERTGPMTREQSTTRIDQWTGIGRFNHRQNLLKSATTNYRLRVGTLIGVVSRVGNLSPHPNTEIQHYFTVCVTMVPNRSIAGEKRGLSDIFSLPSPPDEEHTRRSRRSMVREHEEKKEEREREQTEDRARFELLIVETTTTDLAQQQRNHPEILKPHKWRMHERRSESNVMTQTSRRPNHLTTQEEDIRPRSTTQGRLVLMPAEEPPQLLALRQEKENLQIITSTPAEEHITQLQGIPGLLTQMSVEETPHTVASMPAEENPQIFTLMPPPQEEERRHTVIFRPVQIPLSKKRRLSHARGARVKKKKKISKKITTSLKKHGKRRVIEKTEVERRSLIITRMIARCQKAYEGDIAESLLVARLQREAEQERALEAQDEQRTSQ